MSRIGASPAKFVVTVGDNDYNNGTQDEYGDLSGGNVFPLQYLPALGNRPIYASEETTDSPSTRRTSRTSPASPRHRRRVAALRRSPTAASRP